MRLIHLKVSPETRPPEKLVMIEARYIFSWKVMRFKKNPVNLFEICGMHAHVR